MNIDVTVFEADTVETLCHSAGVLPYAVSPDGQTRHFLLGRERWISNWKGSCRWCAFEGGRASGETVLATALREYTEESLGMCDAASAAMREGKHTCRIVANLRNSRRGDKYQVLYVVPVPWQPELPQTFQAMRQRIEHIDRLAHQWVHVRPSLFLPEDSIGTCEEHADGTLSVTKLAAPSSVLCPPWVADPHRPDVLTAHVTHTVGVRMMRNWFTLRDRLDRVLFEHPSLVAVRDSKWDHLQSVTVAEEFLEKDHIRWWTAAELASVIAERGSFSVHRFRPNFLPMLQTVLAHMTPALPAVAPATPPVPPAPCPALPATRGAPPPRTEP